METTMKMIDTPDTLVMWCRSYGEGVKLQKRGAAIIMEYIREHGKMLSTDEEGQLYLNSDTATEKTTLGEIVDQVCDWNYRDLADVRTMKENPLDFLEYCRNCTLEKNLEEHKFILDRIFKQTLYGRNIKEMAHSLALEMMKEMHLVPDPERKGIVEEPDYGKAAENEDSVIVNTSPGPASNAFDPDKADLKIENREQGRTR